MMETVKSYEVKAVMITFAGMFTAVLFNSSPVMIGAGLLALLILWRK